MALLKKLFNQYRTTNPFTVCIEGMVDIGSTGAVGTAHGKGFTVTRTGTGAYTIALVSQGGVFDILAANASVIHSTSRKVQLLTASAAGGSMTIQVTDNADSAADPASGAKLQFSFVIQNKTVL
jgi:hypothetical protein